MNNSSAPSCTLLASEYNLKIVKQLSQAAYFYIWPICLLFDFAGHFFSFLAFYKESKKNGVYAFQLYVAVARAADTLSSFLYMVTWKWFASSEYMGADWFQKNYSLMWYTAHLGIPLNDMTTTTAMLISLAMSVDRALSIGIPMKYKKTNKKLWRYSAVTCAVGIGILSSVYACSLFNVGPVAVDGQYAIAFNAGFALSHTAAVFTHIRNALWMACLVAVVSTGFTVVYLYRLRTKKVAAMTRANSDAFRETRRRSAEKTLFILTTYYSFQAANVMIILMIHSLYGLKDGFTACEQKVFGPFRAIELGLVNGSDFYVLLLVSEQFRKMIKRGLTRDTVTVVSESAPVLHA